MTLSGKHWWTFLIVILSLALLVVIGTRVFLTPNRGSAIDELQSLLPDTSKDKDIAGLVVANYREYRAIAVRWSAAYFGSIFGSALLSALAGVLLKLDLLASHQSLRNDLAATFAALAALFITLSTVGDFQRKWQANRTAASAM